MPRTKKIPNEPVIRITGESGIYGFDETVVESKAVKRLQWHLKSFLKVMHDIEKMRRIEASEADVYFNSLEFLEFAKLNVTIKKL